MSDGQKNLADRVALQGAIAWLDELVDFAGHNPAMMVGTVAPLRVSEVLALREAARAMLATQKEHA